MKRLRMLSRFVLALVAMQLLVALLHEGLVVGVASGLRAIDTGSLNAQLNQLPFDFDAVHTQLVLTTLTTIRPRGIAVAGPPGEWLHRVLPSFFLNPWHVVPGVWISAVLSRGSPITSLFVTRTIVEILLIVLGSLAVRTGLAPTARWYLFHHPRITLSWAAAFGFYLQAQGAWAIVKMTPSVLELEHMGVGFLARNFLEGESDQSVWLMEYVLAPAITLLLITSAFALLPVLSRLFLVAKKACGVFAPQETRPAAVGEHKTWWRWAGSGHLLTGFALMFALSLFLPRSRLAETNLRFTPSRVPTLRVAFINLSVITSTLPLEPALDSTPTPESSPTLAPSPVPAASRALFRPTPAATIAFAPTATPPPTSTLLTGMRIVQRPSSRERVVQAHWSPALKRFILTNNEGELFALRGINYNTHYIRLPQEEQLRILHRDFKKMREAGANVITGYATFDETTLQVAQEYGLYVIMPYVLDLSGDYLDAAYKDQVKQEFTAFIRRFENHPSLLMWNYDDEPLHNMIERLQRPADQAQAFSDFLLVLAEHAYQTDRYHRPSWLKEPRDWYLDIVGESIARARQVKSTSAQGSEVPDPNRYAVFARSAYGVPLDIEEWLPKLSARVERDLGMPFAIGEYGVVGLTPAERPENLARVWEEANAASAVGNAVYTYGPFQPDPNDLTDPIVANQMALVDDNGDPVDDAWAKLSERWLAQQATEKSNRARSSIPLAVPEFRNAVQQWGGYPSSGPLGDDSEVRQFFVEGKLDDRSIAYTLTLNRSTQQVVFEPVEQVVFHELGEFTLSGEWLKAFMENGGYARFGAPTSSVYESTTDGQQFATLEFAKGWALVQPNAPGQSSP